MSTKRPLLNALNNMMIKDVPSYGNKFFYSLGFLSMIAFMILIVTGVVMVFFGPTWWLTNNIGQYTRSIHMWATQAFVLFVILHLIIVFFTSGFKKPRRLTWAIGVTMMFIVLAETEFGYVLRGDYTSQWRGLQGADFYNGSGIGNLINALNSNQIYGIHIIVVPLTILGLLFFHYLLVRVLGIAKPYRKDKVVATVPANHKVLFMRGGVLIVLILGLAAFLPSPYIKPTTIQSVAQSDPYLMGKTLMAEFTASSDTAAYLDNIAPYTYNMSDVYVSTPYAQYVQLQNDKTNYLSVYNQQQPDIKAQQLQVVNDYFSKDVPGADKPPVNSLMRVIDSLTTMAQAGLYEPAIASEQSTGQLNGPTYVLRFLSDTGVLATKAVSLNITTDQYGMVHEGAGNAPGAWWLLPIGILDHTVLANDANGDRDAAIIFGSLMLTMLAFPFIPYVNQIPDKLQVWRLIWRQKK